jgi:hypothetical protein
MTSLKGLKTRIWGRGGGALPGGKGLAGEDWSGAVRLEGSGPAAFYLLVYKVDSTKY